MWTLTDRKLQENVLDALESEPGVDPTDIGVSLREGVATLRGVVTTLGQKSIAERTARTVFGIRAVANDVEVSPSGDDARSDTAIAIEVANALERDRSVPDRAVQATVQHGWVTLTGEVQSPTERAAAESVVERMPGVTGVTNSIVVP